jgi:hypothetical protein
MSDLIHRMVNPDVQALIAFAVFPSVCFRISFRKYVAEAQSSASEIHEMRDAWNPNVAVSPRTPDGDNVLRVVDRRMQQHGQEQAAVGASVQPSKRHGHRGHLQHKYRKGLPIGIAVANEKLRQMPYAPDEPEQYTRASQSETVSQSGKGIAAPTDLLSGPETGSKVRCQTESSTTARRQSAAMN